MRFGGSYMTEIRAFLHKIGLDELPATIIGATSTNLKSGEVIRLEVGAYVGWRDIPARVIPRALCLKMRWKEIERYNLQYKKWLHQCVNHIVPTAHTSPQSASLRLDYSRCRFRRALRP